MVIIMASISSLIEGQQVLELKITSSHSNLVKNGKKNLTAGIIESRLLNLESQRKNYVENDSLIKKQKTRRDAKLVYLTENHFDNLEEAYLDIRGKFLDEKARMLRGITGSSIQTSTNLSSVAAPVAQFQPQRKMPPIAIPTFSGKYNEWTAFKDLFEALVVDQPLNNIEKFSYLRASLTDDPFVLIKNIALTEDNFQSA